MVNDSVRKEHIVKVSSPLTPINTEMRENLPEVNIADQKTAVSDLPFAFEPKQNTAQISVKMTSPTLVEFQHREKAVPEWRLKVQNAVRKRQGLSEYEELQDIIALPTVPEVQKIRTAPARELLDLPPVRQQILTTSGANALKVENITETIPASSPNPMLNSALRRIEESRQRFLEEEQQQVLPTILTPPENNKHPFYLASKQAEVAPIAVKASVNPPIKPKLAPPLNLDSEPLDTNKLPPLPQEVKSSFSFAKNFINNLVGDNKTEKIEVNSKLEEKTEIIETEDIIEEMDDCAPLAMRFNAGLFDLIIGSFLSLILITPFAISGGTWLTFGGILAFLATCAIVMFIYLTTTIGFYGRTFGMRLFSLEVVDIEGEDYPTMHQAAVSSAVYILSLFFGGVGFLTIPFNEEKRAAHNLISKTIVVKEF